MEPEVLPDGMSIALYGLCCPGTLYGECELQSQRIVPIVEPEVLCCYVVLVLYAVFKIEGEVSSGYFLYGRSLHHVLADGSWSCLDYIFLFLSVSCCF